MKSASREPVSFQRRLQHHQLYCYGNVFKHFNPHFWSVPYFTGNHKEIENNTKNVSMTPDRSEDSQSMSCALVSQPTVEYSPTCNCDHSRIEICLFRSHFMEFSLNISQTILCPHNLPTLFARIKVLYFRIKLALLEMCYNLMVCASVNILDQVCCCIFCLLCVYSLRFASFIRSFG